jgi:hypothetical protein
VSFHGTALALLALLVSAPALAQEGRQQEKQERIRLGDIEDNASQYAGRQVSVEGKVSQVLGPRLFTVDDGKWIDFDGETIVVLQAPLAALVREGDEVTIRGTVRPLVETELEKQSGWFSDDDTIQAEIRQRSGIVAESITRRTGDDELAVRFDMQGQQGRQGEQAANLSELAEADDQEMVGRRVDIQNARVEEMGQNGGFWVMSGNERLYVMPESGAAKVTPGQMVNLSGYVLAFPDRMREQLGKMASDEEIYVYVRQVEQAS